MTVFAQEEEEIAQEETENIVDPLEDNPTMETYEFQTDVNRLMDIIINSFRTRMCSFVK